MDGSRFDAWTRRRFGMAAGGATFAFFAGTHADSVAKKKKKKKKRCKKLGQPCQPGGKRKCCRGNACQSDEGIPGTFSCCKPNGTPCSDVSECCVPPCIEGICGLLRQ
ncbi:MAG: hypothetical protein ACRDJC_10255 [Thermomicrobiales bacterium]